MQYQKMMTRRLTQPLFIPSQSLKLKQRQQHKRLISRWPQQVHFMLIGVTVKRRL